MDWETYKALCDQPQYWSRWMLEQTRNLLESRNPVAVKIAQALKAVPLLKPPDHTGDKRTDMFAIDLGEAEVSDILAAIRRAHDREPERILPGFELAWIEYRSGVRKIANESVMKNEKGEGDDSSD
ncbi:MAG: hypothetical protein O3A63_01420 [Proteobacteria bacterium]|nr:hypothetical protein [Pseudomonadota bacterium]